MKQQMPSPLVDVTDLTVRFPIKEGFLRRQVGWIHAVDGVSFGIARGETLGLVGESGSGKTTIARAMVRIITPTAGAIRLGGDDVVGLSGEALRRGRRRFQLVFQDPYASLDPRQSVGDAIAEPLRLHGLVPSGARADRVAELLALVGLQSSMRERYPHELSGGQRQRVGIARALAVEPEFVVCDEPVSSLDASIQAQVVNLLEDLQHDLGLTYLFIAHDLAVVRHIAARVAVLYMGKIVELGAADQMYEQPRHPYTVALLSAVPIPDVDVERSRRRIVLRGEIPSAAAPPSGCRFRTRCWLRESLGNPELCELEEPPLKAADDNGHVVACHFSSSLAAEPASARPSPS